MCESTKYVFKLLFLEASQKCFESTKPLERITNLPKPKDFPKGHLFFKYYRLLNLLRYKANKRNPLKNRKMKSREEVVTK